MLFRSVLISSVIIPTWADTGPIATEYVNKEDEEESGLISNIKELLQTLNDLADISREWKEKGGWYYVFASTIGAMLDAALGGIEGVYGASYLYTPPLTGKEGHNWVYVGWNSVFFASISLIALALLVTVYKMWKGDTEGIEKPMKSIGIIFVIGLLSYFSLWIIEGALWMQNYAFDQISKDQVIELYNERGVNEEEYTLKDIPGDLVLKAAFANADVDLETVNSTSMSQIFLDEQNGKVGGLIGMIIGEGTQILLGILALIRIIVLRLLAIMAAGYMNGAALTGKFVTYVGLGNILARTIGLQAFFDVGWLVMISIAKTPDADRKSVV